MILYKKGDKVVYDNDDYIITFVWNHGFGMVYYDLEAEKPFIGTDYKKTQMSVHYAALPTPSETPDGIDKM